jgi:molybdopterin synthase sulfur carrier subunit
MKSVNVRYFALLREKAKKESEIVEGHFTTYADLYAELSARYGFDLPGHMIQLAINDEFSSLQSEVASGTSVVFIPPVAGG